MQLMSQCVRAQQSPRHSALAPWASVWAAPGPLALRGGKSLRRDRWHPAPPATHVPPEAAERSRGHWRQYDSVAAREPPGPVRGPAEWGVRLGAAETSQLPWMWWEPALGKPACAEWWPALGRLDGGPGTGDGLSASSPKAAVLSPLSLSWSPPANSPGQGTCQVTCVAEGRRSSLGQRAHNTLHPTHGPLSLLVRAVPQVSPWRREPLKCAGWARTEDPAAAAVPTSDTEGRTWQAERRACCPVEGTLGCKASVS